MLPWSWSSWPPPPPRRSAPDRGTARYTHFQGSKPPAASLYLLSAPGLHSKPSVPLWQIPKPVPLSWAERKPAPLFSQTDPHWKIPHLPPRHWPDKPARWTLCWHSPSPAPDVPRRCWCCIHPAHFRRCCPWSGDTASTYCKYPWNRRLSSPRCAPDNLCP